MCVCGVCESAGHVYGMHVSAVQVLWTCMGVVRVSG